MSEPREFWIDTVTIGRSIGNKCNLFSCADMPSDRKWLHVIEYSAYAKLQAKNKILQDKLNAAEEMIQLRIKDKDQAELCLKMWKEEDQAENKILRDALEFYADKTNFKMGYICADDIEPAIEITGATITHASIPNEKVKIWVGGKRAREALKDGDI